MGSVIAAATAHIHPSLIDDRLILLSPISQKPPFILRTISPLAAYLPRSIVDLITTHYLFTGNDRQLFNEVLQITSACSNNHPPSRKDLARSAMFSAKYSISDLPVHKQILIIAGEHDRLVSQQHTRDLAAKLAASITFLPDTGHLHNYEQSSATAQAILSFLESHPAGSSRPSD